MQGIRTHLRGYGLKLIFVWSSDQGLLKLFPGHVLLSDNGLTLPNCRVGPNEQYTRGLKNCVHGIYLLEMWRVTCAWGSGVRVGTRHRL